MTAIYLKTEDERCFCMIPIKDGNYCTIHEIKSEEGFVKVNGYSKGRFGCLVYYKAKNFVLTSKIDETEILAERENVKTIHEHTGDAFRYIIQQIIKK